MPPSYKFPFTPRRGELIEPFTFVGPPLSLKKNTSVIRTLSRAIAQSYYESRERLGFPMLEQGAKREAP